MIDKTLPRADEAIEISLDRPINNHVAPGLVHTPRTTRHRTRRTQAIFRDDHIPRIRHRCLHTRGKVNAANRRVPGVARSRERPIGEATSRLEHAAVATDIKHLPDELVDGADTHAAPVTLRFDRNAHPLTGELSLNEGVELAQHPAYSASDALVALNRRACVESVCCSLVPPQ